MVLLYLSLYLKIQAKTNKINFPLAEPSKLIIDAFHS